MATDQETMKELQTLASQLRSAMLSSSGGEPCILSTKMPKYGDETKLKKLIFTEVNETNNPVCSIKGCVKYDKSNNRFLAYVLAVSEEDSYRSVSWPVKLKWTVYLKNLSTSEKTEVGSRETVHQRPAHEMEDSPELSDCIVVPMATMVQSGYAENGSVRVEWSVTAQTLGAGVNAEQLRKAERLLSLVQSLADMYKPRGDTILVRIEARRSINLLVVGKTGNGKSAFCNTVLQRKIFKSKASTNSVTKDIQMDFSEFEGRTFKVVDCPGIGDTKESNDFVITQIKKAVSASPEGYDAIVLVLKYGSRYTDEERQSVQLLKKIFGDNFVSGFFITVLTFGDQYADNEGGQTLLEWCKTQDEIFKRLIEECRHRAILFDNVTKDEKKKTSQLRLLVKMVDSIKFHEERYRNEHFEEAKQIRERIIKEAEVPHVREETMSSLSIISQNLLNISFNDPAQTVEDLITLKLDADKVYADVLTQDEGTGALEDVIKVAERIQRDVKIQLDTAIKFKDDHERLVARMNREQARGRQEADDENASIRRELSELRDAIEQKEEELQGMAEELEQQRTSLAWYNNATLIDTVATYAMNGISAVVSYFWPTTQNRGEED